MSNLGRIKEGGRERERYEKKDKDSTSIYCMPNALFWVLIIQQRAKQSPCFNGADILVKGTSNNPLNK